MSVIIDNKIINEGKIIDNYLVNFPQFINKEKESLYKLVIGEQVTVFIIDLTLLTDELTIELPFLPFTEKSSHNVFISWGDGQIERNIKKDHLTHTYTSKEKYVITILGDTPNLFSIENLEEKTSQLEAFQTSLIGVKKLSDSLTNLNGIFKNYSNLCEIPDNILPFHVKNCDQLFAGCSGIQYIPFNFTLPGEGISFKGMFADSGLKNIFNQNLSLPFRASNVNNMFANTKIETFPTNFFQNVTSSLTEAKQMFLNCTQLESFKSNKILKYITNIDNMFEGCEEIKSVEIHLPNLKKLSASFYNCSSLINVEGIQINQLTEDAASAFYNCYNLQLDINDLLEYNNLNISILDKTFYNCAQISGTPKEQYLWKSQDMNESLSSLNTFYNCGHLTTYNFIDSSWGGADIVDYWYGSYEVNIENKNEIYCLPLYKFVNGDSTTLVNQECTSSNFNKDLVNNYDFYINYGDDTAWLRVKIENSTYFYNVWENNINSPFYGYPLTYKINFNEDNSVNLSKEVAYDTLMQNMFSYIFKDITHIYKQAGKYKIIIMGTMPRFYVHEEDTMTNRHLYNIITINRLPFTTLNHAFTNAINLRYLPNEDLTKFPLLNVPSTATREQLLSSINDSSYCFSLKEGYVDKLLNNNPPLFKINESATNSTTFLNRKS